MPKKLKLIARITNETGLWLGGIGFLVGMAGAAIAFAAMPLTGYWIAVGGVLMGLFGILMHFVMNWREIFRIDR